MSATRAVGYSLLVVMLPMMLLGGGCSSAGAARLQFQCDDSKKLFGESFNHAVFSTSSDGDRTIVLINDGLPRNAGSSIGAIQPLQSVPLQQVVRLQILWTALHGTRLDAPSTTNCIVDWIVRDIRPGAAFDSLHSGAGFVDAHETSRGLIVKVRNATLDSATASGNLTDPLGKCNLSGSFVALRDDPLVTATTRRMDEAPIVSADAQPLQSNIADTAAAVSYTPPTPPAGGPPNRAPTP